jgi:ATP-dependent exoDNAse (exonuclease V) alpha subunit
MFLVNDPKQGFFNGTMGEVVDFDEESGYPVVKIFKTRKEIIVKKNEWKIEEEDSSGAMVKTASVMQFPLRLAYAITIHKSQGCTFDYVNLDMSDVFILNMGYVALSRITSLEGLWLKGYNYVSLHVDNATITKDKEFKQLSLKNE